jgi:adenylosuccinate synthase
LDRFLDGNVAVVGLQWGDEGKGKVVDLLAGSADVVVRYCGGANAGHTVVVGGKRIATHLLPSGISRPSTINLIGNGMVLDVAALFQEIDEMANLGIIVDPTTLRISSRAHLVFPYHISEDIALETIGNINPIGTTRRGIGPAYAEKMLRHRALRVADLVHNNQLSAQLLNLFDERYNLLKVKYGLSRPSIATLANDYCNLIKRLSPFVDDVSQLLRGYLKEHKRIIFEGAHAILLDVDHGTYPYVTSSSCSPLGIFSGAGVPPSAVKHFLGVMKAYTIRVGEGPFPTEQANAVGERLRIRGNEYGTTTGRPRRCGWFDGAAVKYSVDLCGITAIAMTMLDVLKGINPIPVCTGYIYEGSRVEQFPACAGDLARVSGVYEYLPGWDRDIRECRCFSELPKEAQGYVRRLEELVGVPVVIIGVGSDRDETIIL